MACTGQSITQANASTTTGYIIYACLKMLIMGQQLVRSDYDERTNHGMWSRKFNVLISVLLNHLWISYGHFLDM